MAIKARMGVLGAQLEGAYVRLDAFQWSKKGGLSGEFEIFASEATAKPVQEMERVVVGQREDGTDKYEDVPKPLRSVPVMTRFGIRSPKFSPGGDPIASLYSVAKEHLLTKFEADTVEDV